MKLCNGSSLCQAEEHVDGCYADVEEREVRAEFPRDVHEENDRRAGVDVDKRKRVHRNLMRAFGVLLYGATYFVAALAIYGISHLFSNPWTWWESVGVTAIGIVLSRLMDFSRNFSL